MSDVQKAHSTTKQEKIENIDQINFGSKSIPLKSERLKQVFKKVEACSASVDSLSRTDNIGDLMKEQLKYADVLDEAQIIIKKEKSEEIKKSDSFGSIYNLLILYTQRLKLKL